MRKLGIIKKMKCISNIFFLLHNKIESFFHISLYSLYFFSFLFFFIFLKLNKEQSNFIFSRKLTNLNETFNNPLSVNNSNIEKYLHLNQFLKDINNTNFTGEWLNNRKYNIKEFNEKKGKIFIYFTNYIIDNNSFFLISFKINDGEYNDNYIIINIEFELKENLVLNQLDFNFNDKEKMSNLSKQITLDLNKEKNAKLKKGNLFFNKDYKEILVEILYLHIFTYPIEYIKGNLFSADLYLNINFTLNSDKNNNITILSNLDNFCVILIILCLINSFTSLSIIKDCYDGKINPKSISPYFLISNIIWNVDIFFIGIYLGFLYSNNKVIFLIPLILNIINNCIESKLLYYSYKSQDEFEVIQRRMENNNQSIENINLIFQNLFKKKLCKVYLFIFFSIIFFFFFLFYIFTHISFLYFYIIIIFIPQIHYNIDVKIMNNSIPKQLIINSIIQRLFIPFYFKGFKINFLYGKPNYIFCYLSILSIIIEVSILYLQKIFGNRFFIPKKLRKDYYNYYKSVRGVEEILYQQYNFQKNEIPFCSICLSPFENKNINTGNSNLINENSMFKESQTIITEDKNKNKKCCCKNKQNLILITPCNHLFHSECLKQWYIQKNECPICKKSLPLIE